MQLMAERVVRGREAVPQALQALNARVDGILEKRRWLLERDK
jgi:multiple sugar transport system substrate-binding protein